MRTVQLRTIPLRGVNIPATVLDPCSAESIAKINCALEVCAHRLAEVLDDLLADGLDVELLIPSDVSAVSVAEFGNYVVAFTRRGGDIRAEVGQH